MAEPSYRRFVVGYALLPKKQQSFIRPSLVGTARDRGVDLVPIDPSRPLVEQGPFDCVIHKLHGDEWKIQLADFAAKNPGVPIVDQPLAIERLHNHNRITMPQSDSEIDVTEIFGVIPNQMMVYDSSSDAFSVITHIRFPIIDNPRAFDDDWVIFKVYVAGNYVQCVRRKYLPDVAPEQHPPVAPDTFSNLPPSSFFEKIARGLRQATGLRLFKFDMIRDSGFRDAKGRNHYYMIDINYFPGYSKMPGYEEFVTNFFVDMVHQKGESADASSSFSAKD